MSLTPVEIRHVKIGRRPFGYQRGAVDALLARVTTSFEDVWRERADLRDELERLQDELARFRELEVLLRNSLVSAERAADDLRAQARREGELILEEARLRAREITGEATDERERVIAEIRRLETAESDMRAEYRAFLLAALDRVDVRRPSEHPQDGLASAKSPEQGRHRAA